MRSVGRKIIHGLRRASGIAGATLLALSVASCGGGTASDTSSDTGEVYIGLTDAVGDFSTYTVDVTSISLTRANGATVETLPVTTQIDFSQYVEMTEFLTAQSVPVGSYVAGSLTIDYSAADIWVENESGKAVKVENLVDESGDPVTSMTLEVKLEDKNRLIIAPGIPASLTLDFDLSASHQTVFENGEPTTTIEPVLIADVELERGKTHRVRGPLISVNVPGNTYRVGLRPFHHKMGGDHRFGRLDIHVSEDTVYEIDGASYTGAAGLNEMNNLPVATATIALGELKRHPRRFVATQVYAGTSVPGGDLDVITGHVTARVGNLLTIVGATLVRSDANAVFNDVVEVTVADSTIVKKQLSTDDFTIDSISVGQRVRVFGTLTNTDRASLALDASAGNVRLLLTRNNGVVVDGSNSELTVDLSAIGRHHPEIFDFSGTGTSPANDADPDNYELDTSTLNVSALGVNAAVEARGFVTAFGSAPKDFDVHTLIDVSELHAVLVSNWDPASASAFSRLSESGIELDVSGAGRFHHISQGGVRIDLQTLRTAVVVVPTDERGIYTIRSENRREMHSDFANFIASVQTSLDNGATVERIVAPGFYNNAENELVARRVHILLSDT